MTTVTLIQLTPEEFSDRITRAVKQALLEVENRTLPSVLSVPEIARDSGFSKDTVRSWIQQGRRLTGGRIIKLKVMNGLAGDYRIRREVYRTFLSEFPDIVCPSPKRTNR